MKNPDSQRQAVFAGGCFWCMVHPFQSRPGVIAVEAGYTGGDIPNPTYQQVCSGETGHFEAVRVTYDPDRISYAELLEIFWTQIDPTDPGGQFADRGSQYYTAVFYQDEAEKVLAEKSRQSLEQSGVFSRPVVTRILPAVTFYPAEEYHQNYHKKNPIHYQMYRAGSGREAFIQKTWKTQ